MYYKLTIHGIENCVLIRLGVGVLLFWLCSFFFLMGKHWACVVLATVLLPLRCVAATLYCRNVVKTFRMQVSAPRLIMLHICELSMLASQMWHKGS